jgi:transcriptional regulator with XRE-family HTH domain
MRNEYVDITQIETLGEAIHKALLLADRTNEQVCETAGISVSSLYKYLNNSVSPTVEAIIKLQSAVKNDIITRWIAYKSVPKSITNLELRTDRLEKDIKEIKEILTKHTDVFTKAKNNPD